MTPYVGSYDLRDLFFSVRRNALALRQEHERVKKNRRRLWQNTPRVCLTADASESLRVLQAIPVSSRRIQGDGDDELRYHEVLREVSPAFLYILTL